MQHKDPPILTFLIHVKLLKDNQAKKQSSRPNFKVGIAYNSIIDDDSDDDFTSRSNYNMTREYETSAANTSNDSTFHLNFSDSLTRPLKKKAKYAPTTTPTTNNATNTKDQQLLPVSSLPDSCRSVFNFEYFNRMQTESFDSIYHGGENCVISSPTGSGKTVLFELAILSAANKSDSSSSLKALYIAPTKSLCNEKYLQWKTKFLNLSVGMLTSDTSYTELERVKQANIIICTPEKWDVITRKWSDYPSFFALLRLVLVDEIHILQENRGSTLEVILTRMNRMCQNLRILAVSATIPNIQDIADWLKTGGPNGPSAKALIFDDSYRQVKLKHHIYSFPNKFNNDFQMDALFNTKLRDLIYKHSKGKPVLIFCPTRQSTIATARYIAQRYNEFRTSTKGVSNMRIQDRQLEDVAIKGVAFHHAGLSMADRAEVEHKFIDGDIQVLCSTSTLAVGVNLPAYLVIIKGTKMWSINGSQEYTILDILQMIGRAGRPQFETEGCALLLTDETSRDKYENLLNGASTLESCLHLNLAENIVAEITLGTIKSTQSATEWLRSTFLYRRYIKNLSYYSNIRSAVNGSNPETQLTRFCERKLNELLQFKIICENNGALEATGYGLAMSRHYILEETVKNMIKPQHSLKTHEIIQIVSEAREFENIRLKHNEKKLYREINANPLLRYPFLDKTKQLMSITTREQKVSLIIQYELGGLEFPSYKDAAKHHQTLVQDKMLIFRHLPRVLKCMIDCFIEKNDGDSLKYALFVMRSVVGKGWEDTPMILRQLNTIGLVSLRKLVCHGVSTFDDMANLTDQQIEYYLSLKPGNGSRIKSDLQMIPSLELDYCVEEKKESFESVNISFKINVNANFKSSSWHGEQLSLLVMLKTDTGVLIDFRRTSISKLKTPKSFRISVTLNKSVRWVEFLYSCEQIGGTNHEMRYYLRAAEQNQSKEKHMTLLDQIDIGNSSRITDMETSNLIDNSNVEENQVDYKGKNTEKDEDEELLALITETGLNIRKQGREEINDRVVLENGNMKCHHTCKDKTSCRHLCCRDGIPGSTRRKTVKKAASTSDQSSFPKEIPTKLIVQPQTPMKNRIPEYTSNITQKFSYAEELASVLPGIEKSENEFSITPRKRSEKVTYVIPTSSPKQPSSCNNPASESQDSDLLNFLGSDIDLV